jgi:hypothetical protein
MNDVEAFVCPDFDIGDFLKDFLKCVVQTQWGIVVGNSFNGGRSEAEIVFAFFGPDFLVGFERKETIRTSVFVDRVFGVFSHGCGCLEFGSVCRICLEGNGVFPFLMQANFPLFAPFGFISAFALLVAVLVVFSFGFPILRKVQVGRLVRSSFFVRCGFDKE